ncbi:MAG: hypothetical protein HY266_00940 [Deltaproteobacteria bacterium]|nr:hypothetical protein [Deltaproteobacteria bacterium]
MAVASYMNMANYGDGSANTLLLDRERYLLTPEQGYLDKEGRLYLLNRSARALASEERLRFARLRVTSRIPYSPSGKVKVRDLSLLLDD